MKIEAIRGRLGKCMDGNPIKDYFSEIQLCEALETTLSYIDQLEAEKAELEDERVTIGDIRAEIADGGTSCHWCMERTKIETAERCAQIAEELKPDRFGNLERFQVADAIRNEFKED